MKESREFSGSNSLTEEIADIIRDRILHGEYEIGEKIRETQISEELNVSRTPIREAFKLLENEGLLDYIPNRGCFAKGFTLQDIEDIYAVREVLEKLAVERALARISDEEIRGLEEECDLMEFYAKKKDTKKVLELNSVFHDKIYVYSRSRFMAQVLRSYKEYLDKTRKYVFYEQAFLEAILEEHRYIVKAMKERDPEAAAKAVEHHLMCSRQRAEHVWQLK